MHTDIAIKDENNTLQWYDIATAYQQRRIITMSLAIALVGKDSLVVASDTREMVTLGDLTFFQDDVHKIKVISDKVVLTVLGNLAGYCNYLVSYFVSKELVSTDSDANDVESFTNRFSKWASGEYRQATHGMSPVLLNSPSNRIEIMVAGYNAEDIPQIYVIRNDASELALVPHLLDVPYHVSGVVSAGVYWMVKSANLWPISTMDIEALKTLPLLMIRETANTSSTVSLPLDMFVLHAKTPIQQVDKEELAQLEGNLESKVDIDAMLKILYRREGS